MAKYVLELCEKQAAVVSRACEIYTRLYIGQFDEIIYELLDSRLPSDDYCQRREQLEQKLLEARQIIYPELNGAGHSYGVGKFENGDTAWDVYQVLRYNMAGVRDPERRSWSVCNDTPMCTARVPLPKCEIKREDGDG